MVGGNGGGEGVGRKAAAGAAAGEAQMDYKTFLDLVLAMDNKQTRQVFVGEGGGFVPNAIWEEAFFWVSILIWMSTHRCKLVVVYCTVRS